MGERPGPPKPPNPKCPACGGGYVDGMGVGLTIIHRQGCTRPTMAAEPCPDCGGSGDGRPQDDYCFRCGGSGQMVPVEEGRSAWGCPDHPNRLACIRRGCAWFYGGTWTLRLICCGRDDGIESFDTWDAADVFREFYTTGPGVGPDGHTRAAILQRHSQAGPGIPRLRPEIFDG